jgi:CheY-like chemotaxis protein
MKTHVSAVSRDKTSHRNQLPLPRIGGATAAVVHNLQHARKRISESFIEQYKHFGFSGGNDTPAPPAPRSPPADEAPVPKFKADGETISNGKVVLIVDDDPVFTKATAIRLHFNGFEVRTAKENSEALAALGREPADAVIMDVQFPADVGNGGLGSWDGFQIMHWMRSLPEGKAARFIVVSNSDSPAYRLQAQQLGAVAYFQKPLDYEQLFEVLNQSD